MYLSDKLTDEELEKLERRLKRVYSQAWNDLSKTTNDYFADFDRRWAVEYQKFLDGKAYKTNGKPDKKKFDAWVRTQIGRGERWAALRDHMGEAIGKTNVKAADMINGVLDGVYALNANYEAFRLEGYNDALDFALYDRDTVRRLAEGKNAVEFRTKSVNPVRDYAWNKTQIENQLMAGILAGKSPKQIADSFLQVMGRNQAAAIRNARTSVTSAQNAGRMDTYRRAKERGAKLQIEWISTWDARTRTSHANQDGERVELGEAFSNGCKYPGDPAGRPEEVYNCRCTTRAVLPGINDGDRETYEDWKVEKEYIQKIGSSLVGKNSIKDSEGLKNVEYNKPKKYKNGISSLMARINVGRLDDTSGSCASAALAYIGNRAGYNVTDFRGGDSLKAFADHEMLAKIGMIDGVDSHIRYSKAGLSTSKQILKNKIDENKEYLFSAGSHSAILKLVGDDLKYLELQADIWENGWYDLTETTLKRRFELKDFYTNKKGERLNYAIVLIDTETLYDKKEFIDLLGYINNK